eukprot:scaffold117179_cov28-Tisochrysis_lutea.AAC.7
MGRAGRRTCSAGGACATAAASARSKETCVALLSSSLRGDRSRVLAVKERTDRRCARPNGHGGLDAVELRRQQRPEVAEGGAVKGMGVSGGRGGDRGDGEAGVVIDG